MTDGRGSSAAYGALKVASISKFPARRFLINELQYPWREEIEKKLNYLMKLEEGWDGYRGRSIPLDNVYFALKLIETVCPLDAPAPEIFPGAGGELQIEWHAENTDIELFIRGPNDVVVWHESSATEEDGEEHHLTNDFSLVADWIKEIMESKRATSATAA